MKVVVVISAKEEWAAGHQRSARSTKTNGSRLTLFTHHTITFLLRVEIVFLIRDCLFRLNLCLQREHV
jgi:hypothetical protein